MTVLIAYGTTGGGTGEIAEWVAEELRAAGLRANGPGRRRAAGTR